MIFTDNKVSKIGQLNTVDLHKIARDTAIFFAAPTLIYLGSLQGILTQNGFVSFDELVPNAVTIGALEGWFIGIAINFLLKLSNGTSK